MKSQKEFNKKNAKYRKIQEEDIRIKVRKKQPKKINKHNYYLMLEDPNDLDVNAYQYGNF